MSVTPIQPTPPGAATARPDQPVVAVPAVLAAKIQALTTMPVTPATAGAAGAELDEAVRAAARRAAVRQGGLAPLLADLAQVVRRPDLPEPVRAAIRQVLALRTRVDPPPTAAELKQAVARSGLFLESRLAADPAASRGPPPSAGSDLKVALLVFRQVLSAWQAPAAAPTPPSPAQAPPASPPAGASSGPQAATSPHLPQASARPPAAQPNTPAANAPLPDAPAAYAPPIAASRVAPQAVQAQPTPPPAREAEVAPSALSEPSLAPPAAPQRAGVPPQAQPQAQRAAPLPQSAAAPLPPPESAAPLLEEPPVPAPAARIQQGGAEAPSHRAATAPPPPYARGPLGAQAPAAPSLTAEAEPAAIGQVLLRETEAALARQELHQIASLPQAADPARPGAAEGPKWMFEVPIAAQQGSAVAQFEIGRDGGGGQAGCAAAPVWSARFSFDMEPMGPVHAQVTLAGERAGVMLWAERPETLARLHEQEEVLNAALRQAAFAPEVTVRPGAPAVAAPAAPGRFVDQAT